VEVTGAVRPKRNGLTIEVSNTWSNRLVGDARAPQGERYCRTNITASGPPRKPWKEIPLHESGLFGPVELIPAVTKTISLTTAVGRVAVASQACSMN
jgi:hypothetical protein